MRDTVHPRTLGPTPADSPEPDIVFLPPTLIPLSRNNPHRQRSDRPHHSGSPRPDRSSAPVDSYHSRRSPHRRRQSVGAAPRRRLGRCTQIFSRPDTSSRERLGPEAGGDLPVFHPTASVEPEFSRAVVAAAAILQVAGSPGRAWPPARFVS